MTQIPQPARRKTLWWPRLLAFAVLAVVAFLGYWFGWPRYLRWFHTRQENAIFNEKLAGKMIRISMPMSPRLHRKITAWVYLPPGYSTSSTRYPVIYVLHGMPGEVRDCFVKGQIHDTTEQLILSHRIPPVILVSFDGHGPANPADVTNFLDRADGTWQMESFMMHELVPWMDTKYRTIPNAKMRAIVGVSAGGYAAFNLILKHPDIWTIGASHTGFFSPNDDVQNMTNILGAPGPLWNANDPTKTMRLVTPQQGLSFYMDIGQRDEELPEFKQMQALMQSRRLDFAAHVFPGRHTWEYWGQHYHDSLLFIGQRFARNQKALLAAKKNVFNSVIANALSTGRLSSTR